MIRRTPLTFAAIATLLFIYGLSNVIGRLPPNPSVLLVPLLIPFLGVVVSLPLWVMALKESARTKQWSWFVGLVASTPIMPIMAFLYFLTRSLPESTPRQTV